MSGSSTVSDFFDVHHLAEHRGFEGAVLVESIRRTFVRRGTPIPGEEPIGLTGAYWEDRRAARPRPPDASDRVQQADRAKATVWERGRDGMVRLDSRWRSVLLD